MPHKDPIRAKEYFKEYRERNKEHIKAYRKNYWEDNKEVLSEKNKARSVIWRKLNKERDSAYHKEYAKNNRSKMNEACRRWRKNNPEKAKERDKQYNALREIYRKERYLANKENALKQRREYHRKIKYTVLSKYSKFIVPMCNHPKCLETDLDVLQLDHINNDGKEHRKQLPSNKAIWRWVINNNFPPVLQVLCANHNFKKYMLSI